MKRVKSEQKTLEELRARHRFCISPAEVARQVRQGRIPKYFEQPEKYLAYCDAPEDGVCASPDTTEASVLKLLNEKRTVGS